MNAIVRIQWPLRGVSIKGTNLTRLKLPTKEEQNKRKQKFSMRSQENKQYLLMSGKKEYIKPKGIKRKK